MRALLGIDTSVWSVASAFEPAPRLNIFGDKKTTEERRRCQPDDDAFDEEKLLFDLHYKVAEIYAVTHGALKSMPWCREEIEPLMLARGHPLSFLEEELGEGADSIDTSTPWGLARAYVDEGWSYLAENDGWNADGSMGGREFNRVPFSGDFSMTDSKGNSWTPYTPRNTPYELVEKKKWQPLLESDGLGYISTQEHVTPHIGSTGRYFGFSSKEDEEAFASRKLKKPDYINRYGAVSRDVLAESAITATDGRRQFAISFFDNKFNSLIPLKIAYFLRDTTVAEYTTTDFYQVTLEVQLAIYNSVLLTWKEKIRQDRPRPPTMIKHKLGDELVEAYAGPDQGVQTMKASEWQPFIRTMPHSEYPSGSSCLCKAFATQVQNFLGTDVIEPSLQFPPGPPPAGFDAPPLEFSSWSEIAQGAVTAGVELCGGDDMAKSIHDSLERLKNGDESAAIFKRDIGELMVVLLLLAGAPREATTDEIVDIRPVWMPLEGHGDAGASVAGVFRSSEVLQMYHLQATAQLYEQGGLNHDMSFVLTAVAFYSLERPDTKVSMAYHPTNMTISLLPVISEDGRELRWDHQAASTSYVMGVDQAYWTAGSYMGETTGAFFSYAVEFSLDYNVRNPRYQPFSVYEDYPGREFLRASSSDEYVWALLSAAQTRGVRLTPALLPQKHKTIIYSHSQPEIIVLNGDADGGGGGGGSREHEDPAEEGRISDGGRASGNGTGPASTSQDSWSSSSLSSSAHNAAAGEEGGLEGEGEGGGDSTNSTDISSASSGVEEAQGDEEEPNGDERRRRRRRRRRQRGRTLLWGSSLRGPLEQARATPAPAAGSAVSSGEDVVSVEPANDASHAGNGGSGEGGRQMETAGAEGVVTLQPTVSSTEVSVAEGVLGETPAPAAALDDWQQVVAYYQSLQLCLQERKFSFVTSLKDFAQYFDCLDDVAFISIGPHEYYKVNITSTKLDHVSIPEELPEVPQRYEGFTWVDTAIAIWILMIMACGIHGLLWQAAVIQHWLKSYGYGDQTEEALEDGDDEHPRQERHPSFTRQVTTEYLRLGELFLGKTDDYQVPPSPPSAGGSAAPAAASAADVGHPPEGASDETAERFGGSNDGRPPQQSPPKRGAHSNGAAKAERGEREAGGAGTSNPRRGRRVPRREEEDGEGVEMRATAKSGSARNEEKGGEEGEGENERPFGNASGGAGTIELGKSRSPPPRPLHGAGRRSRARGPYRSGVDGAEDRWIGFAGSPRGERPTSQRARQWGSGDVGGEELVGNGVEYYAAGGGSENRHQDSGKEAAVDFVAAPQGETWTEVESEAFLEEGLEEMLSGTSR
eukprot:g3684.t2